MTMSAIALAQTPVSAVKTVFLTRMPGGLEQYLALQLTQQGVLQVVTDSSKADVVLTDNVGDELKKTLAELDSKQVQSGKAGEVTFARPSMRTTTVKGTVFLVDRKSGDVLWSTLEKPKSTTSDDLNKAAKAIVERLMKAKGK